MQEIPTATRQETIDALLDDARRESVPIRRIFVQQGTQREPRAGLLADFVQAGSDRTLELYLLVHAVAARKPFDVRRDSRVWARMVGLDDSPSSRSAVSKSWRWLQERQLVSVERVGRLASVTILREDGKGRPYRHPGQKPRSGYFQLPFTYWRDGWHERLTVPGKAMLLIALSLQDDFPLPYSKAPSWYGIAPSTAERGLRELRRLEPKPSIRQATRPRWSCRNR